VLLLLVVGGVGVGGCCYMDTESSSLSLSNFLSLGPEVHLHTIIAMITNRSTPPTGTTITIMRPVIYDIPGIITLLLEPPVPLPAVLLDDVAGVVVVEHGLQVCVELS